MRPVRAIALAFALLAIACQSARPPEEARWIVDVSPTVSIDWDSDIDGYDLHDVRTAARLDDGRIAVVDGGSAEIRWFDRDGAFLARLGGDSVFYRIKEAVRGRGDTIIVRTLDPAIVRVDAKTAAVAGRAALAPGMPYGVCIDVGQSVAPNGSLLLSVAESPYRSCPPPPDGPWRQRITLARLDPAAGAVDTLTVTAGRA